MRRDLIIGILISALLHGGVFASSYLKSPPKKAPPPDEPPTIELMKMPDLEPEDPEPIDDDEARSDPVEFAPPMATDVPQLVTVDSFVQQVQPPPPEGLKPVAGVIAIPQGNLRNLGKGIEVFDINTLDQKPIARVQVPPQYPFEMRRAGIEGEVVIEFIVDTSGDVRNPFVVRSSQREFEAAALQAVSKWKFRPGKKGGRVVNTGRVQQLITFTIND